MENTLTLTSDETVTLVLDADGFTYHDLYPRPAISLTGTIEGSEHQGSMHYRTSSWGAVRDLPEFRRQLDEAPHPVRVRLSVDTNQFASSAGDNITYTRPHMQVIR